MKKDQTMAEAVWQFFCSVKLAVYTLVLLASTSVIGTVILQNGASQEYVRLYGQGMYNVIKVFRFDDMYHAWWFIGLMTVLCINIVVCSIKRLSATWKIIFPKKIKFNPERFRRQKNRESFTSSNDLETIASRCETFLSKKAGNVLTEKSTSGCIMYAEKGRWTRTGVYVVHASILLLLIGALIGSFFGFKANLQLNEGQTSNTVFRAQKRTPVTLDFSIRCNDFDVKFYDTGAPEEFKSSLTIIENGKERFTKDILVNHPLRYKGINIFQSSYGAAPPDRVTFDIIRLSDNKKTTKTLAVGDTVQMPEDKISFKLEGFLPNCEFRGHNLGGAFIGSVTFKNGKSQQIALPVRFPSFDKMRKGKFAFIVNDFEQKYYTGLQVTKDPGIWYVYSGFILLIIGCWITFFMSHDSYCIEIADNKNNYFNISLSGITNRNSQAMTLKIRKMATTLKDT